MRNRNREKKYAKKIRKKYSGEGGGMRKIWL
jgi:hypothetical protein